MYKPNCTIDDCKLFINHDGKCKTEYDFWINKEKFREDFKNEAINEYKENLICSLNIFLGHYIDEFKKEEDTFYLNKLKGSIEIIQILINKIKSKEFD